MGALILMLWFGYFFLVLWSVASMNGTNLCGMVLLTAILIFSDRGCTVTYGSVSDPKEIHIGGGGATQPPSLPVLPNPLEE